MSTRAVLQRIGVIGDVHQEDKNLESALRFFAERDLDAILCVGDIWLVV